MRIDISVIPRANKMAVTSPAGGCNKDYKKEGEEEEEEGEKEGRECFRSGPSGLCGGGH